MFYLFAFFCRTPGDAIVKLKMLYSSSKEALKKALNTTLTEIQATDHDELSIENHTERIFKIKKEAFLAVESSRSG